MSIRTTRRWSTAVRLWSTVPAMLLASVTIAAWMPAAADAAASCGIGWGSLDKAAGDLSTAPIVNVRAGQHSCYDRLIVDVAGAGVGYRAGYVPAVHAQARGEVLKTVPPQLRNAVVLRRAAARRHEIRAQRRVKTVHLNVATDSEHSLMAAH